MARPSTRRPSSAEPDDPEASAEGAGLRYVTDEEVGITRRRAGKGWTFHGLDGRRITDATRIERAATAGVGRCIATTHAGGWRATS